MIYNFKEFIKEELKISSLDDKMFSKLKENLKFRLEEYEEYILDNISIVGGKVYYKNFEYLDKRTILRELNNEFTENFIEEIGAKELIIKLELIMREKSKYIKSIIKKTFRDYHKTL